MTDRILDLSDAAVHLTVRYEQLIVERPEAERVSIPLSDIAVIVASHPHIRYSQSVLAGLAENGGVLVACDARCFPVAMMLPLEGHSTQAERFAKQTQLSLPAKKRMWKQIVQAKIAAQAAVLQALHGDDAGLAAMAARVGSGDSQNLEATASQRYWPRLFGDPKFRRRREGEDQNRDLNYGYAVLRAITARAISSAGLHPSFGLHHSNRYNAFALADDLMEPYRPLVDHWLAATILEWGFRAQFDKAAKRDVLDGLLRRFDCEGQSRTLFDWIAKTTSSLAAVCLGEAKELYLPRLRQPAEAPRKAPGRELVGAGARKEETG
jgi:CRISPR-associated protein Cas1